MKRKSWGILLLSALLVIATGCGAGGNQGGGKEEGFSAGLVTDTGGINDESFNQSAWDGMEKGKKDLGAKINIWNPSGMRIIFPT